MKKELLVASAFAAFAALAADTTVVTSNEMGFVPVSSGLSKAEGMYLVTAPFSGYEGGNIKVADFLQTANLVKDDELFIPNGAGYDNYKLNASKGWDPVKKCTISGGIVTEAYGTPATDATVARGTGFFVKTSAEQINLFGNAEKTAKASELAKGWKLIGSTIPTGDVRLLESFGQTGDMILLADGTKFLKKSDGWKKYVVKVDAGASHWQSASTDVIPAGVAFWYSAANAETLTF